MSPSSCEINPNRSLERACGNRELSALQGKPFPRRRARLLPVPRCPWQQPVPGLGSWGLRGGKPASRERGDVPDGQSGSCDKKPRRVFMPGGRSCSGGRWRGLSCRGGCQHTCGAEAKLGRQKKGMGSPEHPLQDVRFHVTRPGLLLPRAVGSCPEGAGCLEQALLTWNNDDLISVSFQ